MEKVTPREKLFSRIIGEWMFGLTDTVIVTSSGAFPLMSHELLMYTVQMAAGDEKFMVRNAQNELQALDRTQMQGYLKSAGQAMAARHAVLAGKLKALAAGESPDPTTDWPRRNAVLAKAYPQGAETRAKVNSGR
jgi:hypothetical protein